MLTIPNIESSPTFDGQSVSDATDWAAQSASEMGTGVLWGMQVVSISAMAASVQAGSYTIGNTPYGFAGASVAVTAASVTDRRDIVSINASGTLLETAGTPCGTAGWTRTSTGLPPVKPAIPALQVLLGEIYVAYNTSSISAGNIIDKTTLTTLPLGAIMTATQTSGTTTPAAITQLNVPLVPSTNYNFEADLYGTNSASGSTGISVAVFVPGGATLTYDVIGQTNSTATIVKNFVTTTTAQTGFITTSGFTGFIKIAGAVIMSTATGSLQIEFASQTGSTTGHGTATMNIGSNLVVTQL